jgi:hypothetical protein
MTGPIFVFVVMAGLLPELHSGRFARVSILVFYDCGVRIFDRGAGAVDLVGAALVGESVFFGAELLPADWANEILVGHLASVVWMRVTGAVSRTSRPTNIAQGGDANVMPTVKIEFLR